VVATKPLYKKNDCVNKVSVVHGQKIIEPDINWEAFKIINVLEVWCHAVVWEEKVKSLLQQELVLFYISFLPLWCCTAQFASHILVVTEFLTFI